MDKNSERNANMIVKVARSIKKSVFLIKHRTDQLFRSGLAITSCNTDKGNLELPPVKTRQILERLQTVFYQQHAIMTIRHLRVIHYRISRSFFQGSRSEAVPVEVVTFKGKE
jgi:hypothetical protein